VDESPVSPSYDLLTCRRSTSGSSATFTRGGADPDGGHRQGRYVLPAAYIDSSAAVIFGELHDEDCCAACAATRLFGRLAPLSGRSQRPHPFREGNGRAQRAFFGQLPATPGFTLPGSTLIRPYVKASAADHALQPRTDARDAGRAHEGST